MKIDTKDVLDIFSSRLTALQAELANGHVAEQRAAKNLTDLRETILRIEGAKTVVEELMRYVSRVEESQRQVKTPETADEVTGADRS